MGWSSLLATSIALSTMIAAVPIVRDSAAGGGEIRVVVRGLRNDEGRVGCSLFNHAEGFPRNREKEYREIWTPIHGGSAACEFNRIPAGTYAVTVLHDENSDGKMDFNWIGMPTKGYGFSNNARATLLPPSFDAASFGYDGEGILSISIDIVYRKLSP
jgi:uncharacterized protein (DUF2141 family)